MICNAGASASVTRATHRPPPHSSAVRTSAADVRRPLRQKVGVHHRSCAPMSLSFLHRLTLAIVLAGTLHSASAEDTSKSPRQPAGEQTVTERREPAKGVLRLLPADAVTEHSIDTSRGKLAYTATAGTLAFYDQSGEQSAAVFYTAYVAKDAGNAQRPVTFAFNGGPGASAAYLHLGLVGPKILQFGDHNDAATAQLRDNPNTWI